MSENETLKPCPFCGRSGEDILISQDAPQYPVFVECPCGCTLFRGMKTFAEAAEHWNRRANP